MGDSGNRAAIYARISRDKKDEGETLDGQVDLCQKLAVKHGLEVVAIYREPDGTGASEKSKAKDRIEYDKMLTAARAGEFENILAYADDRLTRRPIELEELIKLVDRTKLKIYTHRFEHYDLSSNQGIMSARILGAVAAGEAQTIAERQKVTFERNALAGKPKVQRQRPFGWEADGLTLREDEANLIRSAVEKIKGGASIASIQHEWNRAGVRTAVDPSQSKKEKKPSGEWEWSVVYRVLLGWRTAGIRTRHREPLRDAEGELVRGAWEPVITIEDRNQALSMLQRLARKKIRSGSWPLAGILRCGECAQPLYGQLPSGTRSRALYACKKGHLAISAGLLEQYLIRLVANRAYREQQERRQDYKPVTREDFPGHAELEQIKEMNEELMAAWRGRKLPGEVVFDEVDRLTLRSEELERQEREFMASHSAPISPLRRSSDALEELLDLQGQFLRVTPSKSSDNGPRFGEPDEDEGSIAWAPGTERTASRDRVQELPFAASDEETAELNRLLRGEFRWVAIRKGKAGRQSGAQFESRVDPVWR